MRSRDKKNGYQFKGNDLDSDEEDGVGIIRRYQEQRQAMSTIPRNSANGLAQSEFPKHIKPPISQSTASSIESVDGYDSFENTNNKKKRKIPTSGSLGNHHSTLSAEMAHMGISSSREIEALNVDPDGGVGQYYGTGNSAIPAASSGVGISGAGRGRYGRVGTRNASGRSPLGVSMNGSNTLQGNRAVLQRREYTPSGFSSKGRIQASALQAIADVLVEVASSDQGIISTAIANAAALSATPSKGQENMSLFDQSSSKRPASTKTQFTFTCESDSAKGIIWPGQHNHPLSTSYQAAAAADTVSSQAIQHHRGVSTQGTQTSPSMAGQVNQPLSRQTGTSQQNNTDPQSPQQGRKPRRPPAKQHALAARQRRLRQDYNNYHHPPSNEDIWICEFCEYESIFGSPPEALVRQYEIKDRRERRRVAEKQRLLEKAKMKGRKGKKGNKNAAKNSNAATQPPQGTQKPRYDQQNIDSVSMQHQGTQSEDYLANDYDEDPIPTQASLPRTPSKIPQPIALGHKQSLRSATGSGAISVGGGDAGRAA